MSRTDSIARPLGGVTNYAHTIFTPVAAGTVPLVKNQYNIINPAGTLATLTVTLPAAAVVNNDVVYIKFTQAVTILTYAGGTVADAITAPSVGSLIVLVYDLGTNIWY